MQFLDKFQLMLDIQVQQQQQYSQQYFNYHKMQSELYDIKLDQRSYRYFPAHEEEKHHFNKPHGARVFFHGQIEHDDFEKKKLAEFQEFLNNNNYDQTYFNPHMLVLFLSAHHYKPEQTYEAMKQHTEFRAKYVKDANGNFIIKYDNDKKVKSLIDAGFFYVCGRDKHFRPTIVFNLTKADLKDTQSVLRSIIFVQEEVIEKLFIPGQVEQWNIIYDLGGMGLTDVPINSLKSALQIISSNYGGRLYKLWIVNAPTSIYFSWKVVKNFLDPITVDKITIAKKNTDDGFWKLYDKTQIQQKYGGSQTNRTKFYPFQIPKAVIEQHKLITDAKYIKLLESGFLKNNVIDPKHRINKIETKQQNPQTEIKVQQKHQQSITKVQQNKMQQLKTVIDDAKLSENQAAQKTQQSKKKQQI